MISTKNLADNVKQCNNNNNNNNNKAEQVPIKQIELEDFVAHSRQTGCDYICMEKVLKIKFTAVVIEPRQNRTDASPDHSNKEMMKNTTRTTTTTSTTITTTTTKQQQ